MKTLLCLILLMVLASGMGIPDMMAADKHFIVVRLDEVRLSDDGDATEGEIVYVTTGATGNRGEKPITIQQTNFPRENWYEAKDDGVNALFMDGKDRAIPVFAFPEAEMGDELLIVIGIADDDETSDAVIIGHAVLAKVGTAVASYFLGPAGGAAVDRLSSAVQREIEQGGKRDTLATYSVSLKRSARDGSTFGLPPQEHAKTFERRAGNATITYTVMRVTQKDETNDWCVSVTLRGIKILDDADDLTQGAGDIYVRARVADSFDESEAIEGSNATQFRQHLTDLPRNSYTKDVHTGEFFIDPDDPAKKVKLYSNTRGSGRAARCGGLPVFLYIEVGVFEDDSQADCSGRTCDDVIGVLPLMYTNRWLREHPGSNQIEYEAKGVKGNARIYLTIDVWDPHADPDAPLSRRQE